MKFLNSLKCSLKGLNLIEASAGTGKTYNIQNLYARMIIEEKYPVDSILVVTYTDAATKELKDRIRKILQDIMLYFKTDILNDDRIRRIAHIGKIKSLPKTEKIYVLQRAIRNFDEAAIYTIHSFCSRMLNEFAFETSSNFNTKLEGEPKELIEEIVEDFWRSKFYTIDLFTKAILDSQKITVENLHTFIDNFRKKYGMQIIPKNMIDVKLEGFQTVYDQLKNSWDRSDIIRELEEANLNQGSYKIGKIEKAADAVDEIINGNINGKYLSCLTLFTTEKIEKGKKKASGDPKHDFFKVCDNLFQMSENLKYSVFLECKDYFNEKYPNRKEQQNIQTFDDLLLNLHKSLCINNNQSLIRQIRNKYKAVLIDEFQDTDPLQYSIFKKIFIDAKKPTFLVGDPKQAIYGFRGADIYTYKLAKKELSAESGQFYTIEKNWRSIPALVHSVNSLFSKSGPGVFANDFIEFYSVKPKEFHKNEDLTFKGKEEPYPLKLYFNDDNLKVPQLNRFAYQQTANEIYKLLNQSEFQIGSERRMINPGDIAILVSSHYQAREIQPFLTDLKIPVVLQATGNVFDSREAKTIELLLQSFAQPNRVQLLKGVLTSDLFRITAEDLLLFDSKEDIHSQLEFEQWITKFRNYHEQWTRDSFIEMFNTFLSENSIKENLLSLPKGERKLTNFLHLAELLQQQEIENRLSATGLITWLSRQRNPDSRDDNEEHENRLETDDEAVQIMTVHKSKGLEFSIVFCPFLWSRDTGNRDFYEFHDLDGGHYFDLTKDDTNREIASDENLEELMRLLYVAVTRAKYKCYIFWGNNEKKISTALSYLFHRDKKVEGDIPISKIGKGHITASLKKVLKKPFNLKPDEEKYSDAIEMVSNFPEYSTERKYISKTGSIDLQEPESPGEIERNWGIVSFSSLISNEHVKVAEPVFDYDDIEDDSIQSEVDDSLNIYNFPAGKRTGNCWHKIFEDLDFNADDPEIRGIVNKNLDFFRLINEKESSAKKMQKQRLTYKMVKNVLNTEFTKSLPGFYLNQLQEIDILKEIEFNFPLKNPRSREQITNIFKKYGFDFNISRDLYEGFMTGFIDLLFRYEDKYFILDWKSNQITGTKNGFTENSILKEMKKHNYKLQYLIYTIAVDKYLESRIADYEFGKHFGGVFYIFLRGVDKNNPGRGVFYDMPEETLIKELRELF